MFIRISFISIVIIIKFLPIRSWSWSSAHRNTNLHDQTTMLIDPVQLSTVLTAFPSVTPDDKGSVSYLRDILTPLGFECHILEYEDGEKLKSTNLYARYGQSAPNLCFAGHVDVVPPGDLAKWTYPPFNPEIRDGILYARGAVDMKCSIGAFIAAVSGLNLERIDGSISLIITSNEEGAVKTNGTQAVLKWLEEKDQKLDFCLVGEPTSEAEFGDMLKIGRRGIFSMEIRCYGKQGHVAYQQLADNPIDRMVRILNEITNLQLDNGTEHFQPSNCEVVSVDVGNTAYNVIPDSITGRLNVRYNTLHTAESLTELFRSICDRVTDKYELNVISSASEPFLTEITEDTVLMADVIKEFTGLDAKISTSGGSSDARFLKNYCNLVEFGLVSKTAHHVNEQTPVADIYKLTDIYREFATKFFHLNVNAVAS